ncbi:hypothetical protein GETHOR_08170 [Geothrix oryzae]|uniref:DNA sulfur modification protein DndB n=1 Tax=Geothrix oryzae TaxID=2927975 RepID=A0ABM8DP46_9BACT|nr:DNA sulfur modification protein DndB [Geothrix oryzae]BDU68716.1 hypothetical protein GETHOR_08170 [Geothrix oryzae]
MESTFTYAFPAIRGIQAQREYFVSMCPMRILSRIFVFNEEEDIPPELRAQRVLNRGRLPEMVRYLLDNPTSYVFSAISASIDGPVRFEPLTEKGEGRRMGTLHVPMDARFIINDGQHRRAAIEQAIKEHPDLGDETIAVVFFMDRGMSRSQQMFADLNRHAVRASSSIGVLYDQRDQSADIVRRMVLKAPVFKGLIEMERATLALRSRKLFTLSSVYRATNSLLRDLPGAVEDHLALATAFWMEVGSQFPEWDEVREGSLAAQDVRTEFLHSHGVVLQAIGRAGNALLHQDSRTWKSRLKALRKLDWSRKNPYWEGRVMIGGRVSKAEANVILTVSAIKGAIGLPLSAEEKRLEDNIASSRTSSARQGKHGR